MNRHALILPPGPRIWSLQSPGRAQVRRIGDSLTIMSQQEVGKGACQAGATPARSALSWKPRFTYSALGAAGRVLTADWLEAAMPAGWWISPDLGGRSARRLRATRVEHMCFHRDAEMAASGCGSSWICWISRPPSRRSLGRDRIPTRSFRAAASSRFCGEAEGSPACSLGRSGGIVPCTPSGIAVTSSFLIRRAGGQSSTMSRRTAARPMI